LRAGDGTFIEWVSVRDNAVFGTPALGRPTAAGQICPKRRIQGRPVDAGLTTGNDFF
jgi:hypothetical protein